ncbi:hypothetical protein GUJ93_ZPchr0013g36165 [Zizania palustris]|uniref:Uncharacterized protein n=1 Tax=Zizania palustris TaxID=103762 RepID=A0A8J6C4J4_ZIZPA|nr:hypothetical protein GUJ93_ZPchr0013g36165 [Zizania palustris]
MSSSVRLPIWVVDFFDCLFRLQFRNIRKDILSAECCPLLDWKYLHCGDLNPKIIPSARFTASQNWHLRQ